MGSSTIEGWSAGSGNSMSMVVNTPGAANLYSPKTTTNLVDGTWTGVPHSDDGVNAFIVTNLGYSSVDASGTNEVIYLQANEATGFFVMAESVEFTTKEDGGEDTTLIESLPDLVSNDGTVSVRSRLVSGTERHNVTLSRFGIFSLNGIVTQASLKFDVVAADTESFAIDVYGLEDRATQGVFTDADWTDANPSYNAMPGFSTADYPNIDRDHVSGKTVFLGTIDYVGGTLGEIHLESTPALVDFINADANGIVTFLLEAPEATTGQDFYIDLRSNRNSVTGEQFYPTLTMDVVVMPSTVKILVAGDSTVSNVEPITGWGQKLVQHFQPRVKVVNRALPGKSSKTFILENHWANLLAKVVPGDFILVQFAHNDSHAPGNYESTDAETDYKDYLRQYADDAASTGANLVFVTSPHRRLFEGGQITQELLPYADAMKAVAQEKQVPVVDLYSLSGADMQELGETGSLPLFSSETDRTHFSAEGAEWLAQLITDNLTQHNLPLASHLQ